MFENSIAIVTTIAQLLSDRTPRHVKGLNAGLARRDPLDRGSLVLSGATIDTRLLRNCSFSATNEPRSAAAGRLLGSARLRAICSPVSTGQKMQEK
jgi:hypothetical protein